MDNTKEKRKYNKISDVTKRTILAYMEKNLQKSIREVAREFSVNPRTLQQIIKKYRETGLLKSRTSKEPRKSKLLGVHKTKISEYLKENPYLTLNEIKQKLIEEFNLSVSLRTISRAIKSNNITVVSSELNPTNPDI
ncbi:hypothetical protein RF11_02790 [Thelohanellus kitauei]|uniref:Insertion element IS150 protein InsJ-like helix-turn-helix domain-containing protein n=1 Tax=Thelohanellus kitauei TaxID=669202 RepID=A0A0C2N0G1_THEKT|nr:hypothetical protein RF11_02790 [Thelohanellus kitauei]